MSKSSKAVMKFGDWEMPRWMECSWRRVPCNEMSCKICGRILRDRKKHIDRGEDPDSWKAAFEDVGNSLRGTLELIKKGAKRWGIDITNVDDTQEPPEPGHFSLYRRVAKWNKFVHRVMEEAEKSTGLWLATEAAADLAWYKNTLAAKVYRQLCNRWHIKHGDGCGDFDYEYTGYVLKECLIILKTALKTLALSPTEEKAELMMAFSQLSRLEKAILTI